MNKQLVALAAGLMWMVASAQDSRIRTVAYDPDEVVKIYTLIGNPTIIQFEEGETVDIDDKNSSTVISMGKGLAWTLTPRGNNIVFKPKVDNPDTRMIVVTNRRTYAFELISINRIKKNRPEPTLILRFDYPDTRALLAMKEAKRRALRQGILSQVPARSALAQNTHYMKQGDDALAPTAAYDDGEFTFLQFDNNRELPMVFKTMPDSSEALVNSHYDEKTSTLVIHEVASHYVLRLGNSVLALRNDGFDPDGKVNVTGTTMKDAVRIKKGEVQDD